jgi:hypothetical protein
MPRLSHRGSAVLIAILIVSLINASSLIFLIDPKYVAARFDAIERKLDLLIRFHAVKQGGGKSLDEWIREWEFNRHMRGP